MNKEKSIFVVTALSKILPRKYYDGCNLSSFYLVLDDILIGSKRSFGYFFSLESAREAVENNRCNIYEEKYELVLIEEIKEGIHCRATSVAWYKWRTNKKNPKNGEFTNGKYFPCKQPKELKIVTNFCMG